MTTVLLSHDLIGALYDLKQIEEVSRELTSDWLIALALPPDEIDASLAPRCIAWFHPVLDLRGMDIRIGPSIAWRDDRWRQSLIALATRLARPGRVHVVEPKKVFLKSGRELANNLKTEVKGWRMRDVPARLDPRQLWTPRPPPEGFWKASIVGQPGRLASSLTQFLLDEHINQGRPRFRTVSGFRRSFDPSRPFGLNAQEFEDCKTLARHVMSSTIKGSALARIVDAFMPRDRGTYWTTIDFRNALVQGELSLSLGARLTRNILFETNETAVRHGARLNRWLYRKGQQPLELIFRAVEDEDWRESSNDIVLLAMRREGDQPQFAKMLNMAWLSLRDDGLLIIYKNLRVVEADQPDLENVVPEHSTEALDMFRDGTYYDAQTADSLKPDEVLGRNVFYVVRKPVA